MIIEKVEKHIKCNWCHEVSNGWEEMFVDYDVADMDVKRTTHGSILHNGPAYYHLRCLGKMFVLRIEGILPDKIFNAAVQELNSSVIVQTSEEEE